MNKKTIGMKTRAKGARTAVAALKLASVTPIRHSELPVSADCRSSIDSLEYLLRLARQNRLPGLMFVAVELNSDDDSARDVICEIKGEAAKDQVITMLGMLPILQKDLLSLVDL